MRKIIKNNYKIIIGILIGIGLSVTTVYAIDAYIESSKVSYDNKYTDKSNVQDVIDELYERSGIHKEKWVDKELNGADPVLQEGLIPVEIKPNGDVYYANLNSEWYNYGEKRWANAIILTDTAKEYKVGDHILDSDIKGYFVWIPRYQYKIWDEGNYSEVIADILNTKEAAESDNAIWKITGNNTRVIDIKFGDVNRAPKMSESEASLNNYYTHPAFTLGNKDLNGIWVGKFETGGSTDSLIVKPNVISLRNKTLKVFFDSAKNFEQNLDSHMMKNTEWGATAYLSHSKYGIGNEVNINNARDFMTGYSAASGTNQSSYPSDAALSGVDEKTQSWNTTIGYLASTTGNITGIYDMSGGTWEYVAGCIDGTPKNSGFDEKTLASEMVNGYIDKYDKSSDKTTYNNRILGDATGEVGPFYSYYENNGATYNHGSWYGDNGEFVNSARPWFIRGGFWNAGVISGQFYFALHAGDADEFCGSRIVLSPNN